MTVQTAMPGRPSNSSVEAQPHAAADKWEFNVVPRDNFKPSRPPHRRDASYAANKALYDVRHMLSALSASCPAWHHPGDQKCM